VRRVRLFVEAFLAVVFFAVAFAFGWTVEADTCDVRAELACVPAEAVCAEAAVSRLPSTALVGSFASGSGTRTRSPVRRTFGAVAAVAMSPFVRKKNTSNAG